VKMVSPELAGKYCAFFRFVHGDNLRFGQKVWCDILVEVPIVSDLKESIIEPKL
jgi:negative regulator of sigma E activity